jgi:hypothetical protein
MPALPRATCAACRREVAVRSGGEIREHRPPEGGAVCEGSGKPALGARVRLVSCTDEHTRLEPGEAGTVDHVDGTGTVFVAWDNGARLGLVREAGDAYSIEQ